MTTTEQSTALATRSLTDAQIQQRIKLNQAAGWGLEKGNPAQLNQVFLVCQGLKLLPGDHVTLYEGKTWITVDGRIELARRDPEYRGHAQRPLSKDEKELWGYDPDDIVIETTMRTATNGEIKAYGRVSGAELKGQRVEGVRLNPVAKHRGVELAMARSLSRCSRFAFGLTAVMDDEETDEVARLVVQERNDPVRNAELSSQHQRIFEAEYDEQDRGWTPAPAAETARQDAEQAAPSRQEPAPDPVDQQPIGSKKDPVWQAYEKACKAATEAGVTFDQGAVKLGMTVAQIDSATKSLLAEVADAARGEQEQF